MENFGYIELRDRIAELNAMLQAREEEAQAIKAELVASTSRLVRIQPDLDKLEFRMGEELSPNGNFQFVALIPGQHDSSDKNHGEYFAKSSDIFSGRVTVNNLIQVESLAHRVGENLEYVFEIQPDILNKLYRVLKNARRNGAYPKGSGDYTRLRPVDKSDVVYPK